MISITKIQLIGDVEGYLDTSDNVPFPVTFSVAEIRDISKRTGAFSKTITLPGTKNNNLLLGSYFDINIVAGTYNVNKIQQCIVIQGGVVVLDSAYIQLISVRKRQNTINEDDIIEYDVIIKDSASMFFSKIGSKELTDLPRSQFDIHNFPYTSTHIIESFGYQYSDPGLTMSYKPYKFWIPYSDQINYPIDDPSPYGTYYRTRDISPAISAKFYWDLIHESAGFSYTWDGLENPLVEFDKLIITDNKENRKAPQEIIDFNSVHAEMDLTYTPISITMSNNNTVWTQNEEFLISLYMPANEKDDSTSYDVIPYGPGFTPSNPLWSERTNGAGNMADNYNTPGTLQNPPPNYWSQLPWGISRWTSNSYYTPGTLKFVLNIDWVASIENYLGLSLYTGNKPYNYSPNPPSWGRARYDLSFKIWNQTISSYYPEQRFATIYPGDGGEFVAYSKTEYANGKNTVIIELTNEYVSLGDELIFEVFVTPYPSVYGYDLRYVDDSDGIGTSGYGVNNVLDINNLTIDVSINDIPFGAETPLYSYVPEKIKQSDFIKSISTMFNLYCVPDPTNPYNLLWKRRDDFYDEGPIVDWTKKLDRSQWQEVQFLPELTSKKITLTYKNDTDEANKAYFNATKEIYGQQEVIFSSEWIKTEEKKEIIFSPTPFNQSIWGGLSPLYNNVDGDYNLRIFYDSGIYQTISPIFLVDIWNPDIPFEIKSVTNEYPATIHISLESGYDINFGLCDYYFLTQINTPTGPKPFTPINNNLYNLNWVRTMNQLDNQKMLIGYFHLTQNDIASLDMSSKVRIDNSYWNINRIIDYDFTKDTLTKVELVSIEDVMKINDL